MGGRWHRWMIQANKKQMAGQSPGAVNFCLSEEGGLKIQNSKTKIQGRFNDQFAQWGVD
jgi:hypothetical protein